MNENISKLHFIAEYLIKNEIMEEEQFRLVMEGEPTMEELEAMVAEKRRKSEEENKRRAEHIKEEERRREEERLRNMRRPEHGMPFPPPPMYGQEQPGEQPEPREPEDEEKDQNGGDDTGVE